MKFITLLLICLLPAFAIAQGTTKDDLPVRSMWAAPMPHPTHPTAGYPPLANVTISTLFSPQQQADAYNHCPELAFFAGRFHAMWINHPEGEDLPGQRVLYCSSTDAIHWTQVQDLFPAPGPIHTRSEKSSGARTKAYAWYQHAGRLYAVAGCYDNWRADLVPIAREILPDGSFGPFFALTGQVKVPTAYPVLPAADPGIAPIAATLLTLYNTPAHWPTQAPNGWFVPTIDNRRLWEPTVYRSRDGKWVALWRCIDFVHRLYASVSDDGVAFPPAQPTDIPDSPSLTRALSLPDGTVLLVGNQTAPAFDNADTMKHCRRDPLVVSISPDGYRFERAYALRHGAPKLRFKGTGGTGFQYPSILARDGRLYVLHTVGKEAVEMAIVRLAELGLK